MLLKKLFGFVLLIVMTISSSYAEEGKNGCEEFGVQILNKMNSECIFLSYKVVRGYLISITPNGSVIPPNMSQTFLMQQSMVSGPTIIVNYMCDGRKISIGSHQNLCFLEAGNITGDVISSDPGVYARYTSASGSYLWSYPGHIYWALEKFDNNK